MMDDASINPSINCMREGNVELELGALLDLVHENVLLYALQKYI